LDGCPPFRVAVEILSTLIFTTKPERKIPKKKLERDIDIPLQLLAFTVFFIVL
jgi:hypothetical protein